MVEIIIAVVAAIGSAFGSYWAMKSIITHEMLMCDKRLEAFKEGLDRGEKDH